MPVKDRPSSEVLRGIYGNHAGCFYEFVLAEATDRSDFQIKLFSLKEKWESLCSGFHDWFKRKEVMILWLALFRVQERESMLKACTFKKKFSVEFLVLSKVKRSREKISSVCIIFERRFSETIKRWKKTWITPTDSVRLIRTRYCDRQTRDKYFKRC